MGIIDDVIGDLFSALMPDVVGRNRRLQRLLRDGETLEAFIDGFRITSNGETDDDWVSVRVPGLDGGFRATVKQRPRAARGARAARHPRAGAPPQGPCGDRLAGHAAPARP